MTRVVVPTLALFLGLHLISPPAVACFAPYFSDIHRDVNTVRFSVKPQAALAVAGGGSAIAAGFEKWNQAPCRPSSPPWYDPFPRFSTTEGSNVVTVDFADSTSSTLYGDGDLNSCAIFDFTTNQITLFDRILHQGVEWDCNWDSANRVALVIAHEVGHFLGLRNSGCVDDIMGPYQTQFANGRATLLAAGHSISMEECDQANEQSWTPTEAAIDEIACQTDPNCDPYAPCWASPGCTCPILIDLDRDQFHLAREDDPVTFDIDADGAPDSITWTSSEGADAFLCWDRNGNGLIDDGAELFGNSTPLGHGGIAPFGFIALAELDDPIFGGDGDGQLDADDSAYEALCVWLDANHNGISETGELRSLEAAGVVSIETTHNTYPRRDAAGNLFLYNGSAEILQKGRIKRTATTDVFFVEIEP